MQAQILNLMRDLQDKFGLTYLFISHNLAVVRHMATPIGVMYLGRIVEIAEGRELFANPRMPYTKMLLGAVPDLAMSGRQRIPVKGEIPNPINPPPGCAFNPRCPLAFDLCREQAPALIDGVACHAVNQPVEAGVCAMMHRDGSAIPGIPAVGIQASPVVKLRGIANTSTHWNPMSNINPDPFTTRPEIEGTFGVVTSTHWIATAVGMGILEKGGNAFDAGVATAFTLQVVEPHLNGPGGDVPIIVHDVKRGRTEVICGQGPAPARRHHRALQQRGPRYGARHRTARGLRARHVRVLDAAVARLRHDAAARRAGARDRLRPRRLSAGRARRGDHPDRRKTVPQSLDDIGRGLSAERRSAEARHAVHQHSSSRKPMPAS